jgi:transcriptional regulator with XRE-family HTH domain
MIFPERDLIREHPGVHMAKSNQFHSQGALDTAARFGDRLRRARKAQRRTLADLESSSRVHRHTLARLEHGDPSVSFGVALAVLEALGLLADLELLVSHPEAQRPRVATALKPLDRNF